PSRSRPAPGVLIPRKAPRESRAEHSSPILEMPRMDGLPWITGTRSMSKSIRYTLLADGSSDRMLLPIINWILGRIPSLRNCHLIEQFADLGMLQVKAPGLAGKVTASLEYYPCD